MAIVMRNMMYFCETMKVRTEGAGISDFWSVSLKRNQNFNAEFNHNKFSCTVDCIVRNLSWISGIHVLLKALLVVRGRAGQLQGTRNVTLALKLLRVCVCVCVCIYIYITYTYIHTYIHTHMYALSR
jgi:hypothetical protein